MPTITGVSVVGRQVLATGVGAEAYVSVFQNTTTYQRKGFVTVERRRTSDGLDLEMVNAGKSIWTRGVELETKEARASHTQVIVGYWLIAGLNWTVIY